MFHSVQKHLQKIKSWQALHAITIPCTLNTMLVHSCLICPSVYKTVTNKRQGGSHLLPGFTQQKENSCTL